MLSSHNVISAMPAARTAKRQFRVPGQKKKRKGSAKMPFFSKHQKCPSIDPTMAFVFQKLKREKDGQVEKYVTGKAYALARLGSSLEWTETDFCQDLLNDSAFHSRAQNFFATTWEGGIDKSMPTIYPSC